MGQAPDRGTRLCATQLAVSAKVLSRPRSSSEYFQVTGALNHGERHESSHGNKPSLRSWLRVNRALLAALERKFHVYPIHAGPPAVLLTRYCYRPEPGKKWGRLVAGRDPDQR